jgi:hypothetical protein
MHQAYFKALKLRNKHEIAPCPPTKIKGPSEVSCGEWALVAHVYNPRYLGG